RCDGVSCDMAMLLLNDIFAKTWAQFPVIDHGTPNSEFWAEAMVTLKESHPSFLFLAEAYWGLESRLQALGFDYTYDKELYDRVVAREAPGVQRRLLGKSAEFIVRSAHFIENHDEPRITYILALPDRRSVGGVILGLAGLRL